MCLCVHLGGPEGHVCPWQRHRHQPVLCGRSQAIPCPLCVLCHQGETGGSAAFRSLCCREPGRDALAGLDVCDCLPVRVCVAQHFVHAISDAVREEVSASGVRVTLLAPGTLQCVAPNCAAHCCVHVGAVCVCVLCGERVRACVCVLVAHLAPADSPFGQV